MHLKHLQLLVQLTINANGKLINLKEPVMMGVVNINSDSFFEGSRVASIDKALDRVQALMRKHFHHLLQIDFSFLLLDRNLQYFHTASPELCDVGRETSSVKRLAFVKHRA